MQLMHLQIKMPQNRRNNVFRSKQTIKKVPLMFSDVKNLKEMAFSRDINKQARYKAFLQHLKKNQNKPQIK